MNKIIKSKIIKKYVTIFCIVCFSLASMFIVKANELYRAVEKGDKKEVEAILKILQNSGQKILEKELYFVDCFGYTPLHLAIANNNEKIVELILKYQTNPDVTYKGNIGTPLQFCVSRFRPNHKIVRLLVDARACVDTRNEYWLTPLHMAVSNRNVEIIKILMEAKADINAKDRDGDTPMHLALRSLLEPDPSDCNFEMIKLLLKAGVNQDICNRYGIKLSDLARKILSEIGRK